MDAKKRHKIELDILDKMAEPLSTDLGEISTQKILQIAESGELTMLEFVTTTIQFVNYYSVFIICGKHRTIFTMQRLGTCEEIDKLITKFLNGIKQRRGRGGEEKMDGEKDDFRDAKKLGSLHKKLEETSGTYFDFCFYFFIYLLFCIVYDWFLTYICFIGRFTKEEDDENISIGLELFYTLFPWYYKLPKKVWFCVLILLLFCFVK